MGSSATEGPLHRPTFSELTRVSARIGCLSFGGPAGQIALMHRELVDERRWVAEEEYLQALNLCHLLPGPEAQQLATWIGWKLHGWKGGIVAGGLFVVPGALVMLALSMLYALAADLQWFAALFLGIKAAVLAIIAQALLRIAGRALKTPLQRVLAVAAFAALFLFDAPFPLVVLAALALGALVGAQKPEWLALKPAQPLAGAGPSPWPASLKAALIWAAIWAAPMIAVLVFLGPEHVLWDIGVFFSQLAVVTFGGAYAVLAYMAQEAVSGFGWLAPGEMVDGLGLAETTPGPLIMVTQFVGYLAAFRAPDPFGPLLAGVLGAALTTWVTFAPCFLWIFAFAPWMERLQRSPALKGGLAAVTAAVVGVIANLALWFALHVLFARLSAVQAGPLRLEVPVWASFDWRAAAIAGVAALLVFALKWSIVRTLIVSAALGLLLGATS
ncbi:chromate efflux transporter [Altererythrobacter soli]|uniref:Chromate efflux transporter n=1 Tax=Croceibacterium soli TaxID=1739690 RepID=A0A6I4UNS2_9SPHN|nr:chromate efflux transporter [Croceibacterium soli]MXP40591.1 chromate efflux transporter [Croceibacterium soli]